MNNLLIRIKDNVAKTIIGKEHVTDLLLTALAAGGHVLLEDVPGTGKTVLAKSLAKSMDCAFGRIQFTPDLLPSDVTGLSYYNQEKGSFVFKEGPVFTNLLLADEINRATPRTQSSLLECMAEKQVTVDGATRTLTDPFFVIEAQMDRFLMRIGMGSLSHDEERQMIDRYINEQPLDTIRPVCTRDEIVSLQHECQNIYVHTDLRDYIVNLVQGTRKYGNSSVKGRGITEGVSPRGTLALLRASQGYAMVQGRDFVAPEDIKAVAVPVLAHRLISETAYAEEKESFISGLLSSIPLPTEDWTKP